MPYGVVAQEAGRSCSTSRLPVSGYGREGEHHTGEAIRKLTAERASSVPRPAQREVYHLHHILLKDTCASAVSSWHRPFSPSLTPPLRTVLVVEISS